MIARTMVAAAVTAAGLMLMTGAAHAQTPAPIRAAQTGAVFLTKSDLADAITALGPKVGLATVAAIRSGNDRVNIDELKRIDAAAEGPVSHNIVTEIYIITDGGGVMETGGTILDGKPMVGPNGKPVNPANIGPSIRGTKMTGGTQHHVGVGDVVMIPPGVPHRFLSLEGTVSYIAVRFVPGYEAGK